MGGEVLDPERIVRADKEWHDLIYPRLDVGLAHADLDLLVEELQHVHGVSRTAVNATDGERTPTPHGLDTLLERRQPVHPGLLHRSLRSGIGQEADERLRHLAAARTVRLHADGVDHGVRSSSVGHLADGLGNVAVMVASINYLYPVLTGHLQALGHEVYGNDPVALVSCDAGGHLADRTEPEDGHTSVIRNAGVLNRLPARRQHVREVHETLIGHPLTLFWDLYGDELRLRDA